MEIEIYEVYCEIDKFLNLWLCDVLCVRVFMGFFLEFLISVFVK